MQRINNKYIRIAAKTLLVLFILILAGGTIAWFKREALLQKAISKATAKARLDYNLDVKIGSAHFTGFSTVHFEQISIVPQNRDSLLHINNFEVGVKLLPFIFGGDIKLSSVKLENGLLNLSNNHGVKNFDFLFKHKKDSTANKTTDLSVVANNLVNQVLYKIPDDLDIKSFGIKYHDDSTAVNLLTKYALIKNSDLSSAIVVNNGESTLHLTGKMRPSDKFINVNLFADNKKVELPFIEKKFGLKMSFDTVSTELKKVERANGETRIYSSWSVRNLLINHPKLALSDIVVPSASMDANIFVGAQYLSVDSSSVVRMKDIVASPYIKYTLKPNKIYELKVAMPMTDAQSIFNSFPQGIFDALQGMQVGGKLAYNLNFYLDSSQPDSVQFDSELKQDHFHIVKYGRTDLTKLNSDFVYTPYEKDKPMPPRYIGAKNPNFTPLTNISPYLQHAVMTAEDPSFYSHHGFVPQTIKKSIAIDFKEKRFKRGGSTISMQLVKNAFLNRHKTLSRKIEETLIVWMIENTHIMNKNRMLEVYFNIIEWGHNVYGIGEAARYYFDKSPAELDLGESIYLASIVPKPKAGLYSFQPDGSLKPYITNYFKLIGSLMASRGYTPADSSGYGFYSVRLKPSLRQTVAATDSATVNQALQQDAENDDNIDGMEPQQPERKTGVAQHPALNRRDSVTNRN